MEVLAMLADDPDVPNKIIAYELGISIHTVRALLRSAFIRIGVASRYEAAAWYQNRAVRERIAA
jgi:DNA-binding CsgD family transcriptional regulator